MIIRSRGFSLVEISIGIVLVGILAVVISQANSVWFRAFALNQNLADLENLRAAFRFQLDCGNTLAAAPSGCIAPTPLVPKTKDDQLLVIRLPPSVEDLKVTCGTTARDMMILVRLKGETSYVSLFKDIPFGC